MTLDRSVIVGTLPALTVPQPGGGAFGHRPFSNLTEIIFTKNPGLAGTLPPEWSHLSGLRRITILVSSLQGSIPEAWSSLSGLHLLRISASQLESRLPEKWSIMDSLNTLQLSSKRMLGTLPPSWGAMASMSSLDLSRNRLTGTIPAPWSQMANLRSLNLAANRLTGDVPEQLSVLQLQRLELRTNALSGTLPRNLPTTLINLDMGQNPFRAGPLPPQWSRASSLTHLVLDNVGLTGSLPEAYSALRELVQVMLQGNGLTGSIPTGYNVLDQIRVLDLTDNKISGLLSSIPVANLAFVRLKLAGNEISGSLKGVDVVAFSRVAQEIDLSRNRLTGTFPAVAISLEHEFPELRLLNLSYNALTGTIPAAWLRGANVVTIAVDGSNLCLPGSTSPAVVITGAAPCGGDSTPTPLVDDEPGGRDSLVWIVVVAAAAAAVLGLAAIGLALARRRRRRRMEQGAGRADQSRSCAEAALDVMCCGRGANRGRREAQPPPALNALASLALYLSDSIGIFNVDSVAPEAESPGRNPPRPIGALQSIPEVCEQAQPGEQQRRRCCFLWRPRRNFWPRSHSGETSSQQDGPSDAMAATRWPKASSDGASEQSSPNLRVDFFAEVQPFLERKIGEGSFGEVFKGRWQGCPVAVKVFNRNMQGSDKERLLQSFAQEVKLLVSMQDSPYIVKVLGACLQRPKVCIIYEYLAGGSLADRIYSSARPPLSLEEVLQIMHDVALGLSALHPRVVHRDLKPQNILLDSSGRAKIIDFGISRMIDPFMSKAATGGDAGTPYYMAPEMFEGHSSEKVDVYALGIIMNECLTRKRPFHDLSMTYQVMYSVAVKAVRPEMAEGIPPRLTKLIDMCWAPDPRDRPSCDLVCKLLKYIMDDACHFQPKSMDCDVGAQQEYINNVEDEINSGDVNVGAKNSEVHST
uniref:Serine threonine protein kinase n=1 Tax=Tetraselmis sp. GSL018 TaxID=582737 RepID=A0A061S9I8_9CHLO